MSDPHSQEFAALALQILEDAAVELHDPRLSYVTIQVDREDWEEWQRRRGAAPLAPLLVVHRDIPGDAEHTEGPDCWCHPEVASADDDQAIAQILANCDLPPS